MRIIEDARELDELRKRSIEEQKKGKKERPWSIEEIDKRIEEEERRLKESPSKGTERAEELEEEADRALEQDGKFSKNNES